MKNFVLFVLLLGSLTIFAANWNAADPHLKTAIEFSNSSWSDIIKQAKTENKVIFLDIYATWCGPCKQLKKNTFTDNEVGAYFNANFINATFDAEFGEGIILAQQFSVHAYPTMLFINPDGSVRQTVIGYRSANQLLREGKSILEKK
jgi:thiol:disulfide interchange protein